MRRKRGGAIDALGCFDEIGLGGGIDARGEFLRVAVDDGEPCGLYLNHDAVALEKDVVAVAQGDREQCRLVGL